ncbi:MAG: IPT/TIG domain-containing protein, partial [Candidatus Eremiobacteraeota bacterium]|nr:IPT/TIG domain-containing protein [Candidatus Eremiobacteraeota bacterium]
EYGWLNEMLSCWAELDMITSDSYPPSKGQIYSHSEVFHLAGLKSNVPENGYGGAFFLDFLTTLFGRELIVDTLKACLRQGPIVVHRQSMLVHNPRRDGLRALQEAIVDRADSGTVKPELTTLWKMYLEELVSLSPEHIDPRAKRRELVPLSGSVTITKGGRAVFRTCVNPLACGRIGVFKLLPGKAPDRDVLFTISQTVTGQTEVETMVFVASSFAPSGDGGVLSQDAVKATELHASEGKSTTIGFTPDQHQALILAVPVGLDGSQPSQVAIEVRSDEIPSGRPIDSGQPSSSGGPYHPAITGISPGEAGINQIVTISGSGFGPPMQNLPRKLSLYSGTAVVFRTTITGKPAEIEALILSWSENAIVVRVPPANYGISPDLELRIYRDRAASNFFPFKLKR